MQDKAIDKRTEVVPLSRFPNLAWQLRSNGSIAPVPVFPNAASSKFISSGNNNGGSTPHPINNPHNSNSIYNLCFSSTPTSTLNNSPSCQSFSSWIKIQYNVLMLCYVWCIISGSINYLVSNKSFTINTSSKLWLYYCNDSEGKNKKLWLQHLLQQQFLNFWCLYSNVRAIYF